MIQQDIKNANANITIIDQKGDLAEATYELAKKHGRKCVYFHPSLSNSPSFNPFIGEEKEAVSLITNALDVKNDFSVEDKEFLEVAIKIIKRTFGEAATLYHLHLLINNPDDKGKKSLAHF